MLSCLLELIISDKLAGLLYLIQLQQIPSVAGRRDGGRTDGALQNRLTAATEGVGHLLTGVTLLWV